MYVGYRNAGWEGNISSIKDLGWVWTGVIYIKNEAIHLNYNIVTGNDVIQPIVGKRYAFGNSVRSHS